MKSPWSLLLLCCTTAHAITWDFNEEGNAQGWYARESNMSGGSSLLPLEALVADGVLRVSMRPYEPGRNPSVVLVSPALEQDSRFFDRVELRVRLVHSRPIVGPWMLTWTNAHNRQTPGAGGWELDSSTGQWLDHSAWYSWVPTSAVTFTTQWQQLTFAGFAEAVGTVWADTLIDVRLNFGFWESSATAPYVSSPEDVPEALEVDWIRLTGVEEQLAGEFAPPVTVSRPVPGALFLPAEFQSLSLPGLVRPAFGDLDADGDPDLVVSSEADIGNVTWIAVYNDGTGRFAPGAWRRTSQEISASGGICSFEVTDLNRDDLADLVLTWGQTTEVWLNQGEQGFARTARIEERTSLTVVDLDADGIPDLWYNWPSPAVFLSDGQGGLGDPREPPSPELDPSGGTWEMMPGVVATVKDATLGLWWRSAPGPPLRLLLARMATASTLQELQRFELPIGPTELQYFGDIDNDGQVDLGVATTLETDAGGGGRRAAGMYALLNQGGSSFVQAPWLPTEVLVSAPWDLFQHLQRRQLRTWDLNGDEVPDQAFVDVNPRLGPNVRLLLGRWAAMPVLEGQYALPGGKLGVADAGDIDGDGDLDLVVGTSYAGGGVWVLRNLSAERVTAVAEDQGASQPTAFILGPNYPNPFNPGTVIPLSLAVEDMVQVEILNLAGQRVRQVQRGKLTAGRHELEWDGCDEAGQPVASGVYLCRAKTGDQVLVRRVVKVE